MSFSRPLKIGWGTPEVCPIVAQIGLNWGSSRPNGLGLSESQEVAGKQYELCGNERPTQRVFFSPGNGMLEVVVIGN